MSIGFHHKVLDGWISEKLISYFRDYRREIAFHHFSSTVQLTGGSDHGQGNAASAEGHTRQTSRPWHSKTYNLFQATHLPGYLSKFTE